MSISSAPSILSHQPTPQAAPQTHKASAPTTGTAPQPTTTGNNARASSATDSDGDHDGDHGDNGKLDKTA